MRTLKIARSLPRLACLLALLLIPVEAFGGLPDGNIDVLFGGISAPTLCEADGAGGFTCQVIPGVPSSFNIDLGDLDGDGDLDAVFGWNNGTVCLNNGSGGGMSCSSDSKFLASEEGKIGDINGDGDADIVWASRSDAINICLGDGSGTIAGFTCSTDPAHTFSAQGVAMGEIDGDGNLDVAVYQNGGGSNQVCLGDGDGGFSCSGVSDTGDLGSGRGAVIADISGPPGPTLSVAADIPAAELETVDIDVELDTAGFSLAATTFSINYDESCLSFDDTDADANNIPDNLSFNGAADFSLTAFHDLGDSDGEIDLSIGDFAPPFATLSDGPFFGDLSGRSVAGQLIGALGRK